MTIETARNPLSSISCEGISAATRYLRKTVRGLPLRFGPPRVLPRRRRGQYAYSRSRTACAPSCGQAAGAPARPMRSSSGSDSSQ